LFQLACAPCSFEEAFFSFVALLDVDFSSGFGCECKPHANMNIIADGILLSFKKSQAGYATGLRKRNPCGQTIDKQARRPLPDLHAEPSQSLSKAG
jgi:hypothetical protein